MQLTFYRSLITLAICMLMTACSTSSKTASPAIKPDPVITQNNSGQMIAKKKRHHLPKTRPAKKQKSQKKRAYQPAQKPQRFIFLNEGAASYYGKRFQGKTTASGVPFDMHQFTAAHKELPFGSRVRVTNLHNNRSVIVTINDRGPYSRNRIIDLSKAAAKQIGMIQAGVVKVKVEVLL